MAIKFKCKWLGAENRCIRSFRFSGCSYSKRCHTLRTKCSICRHEGTDLW